jgi:hypothetical protein
MEGLKMTRLCTVCAAFFVLIAAVSVVAEEKAATPPLSDAYRHFLVVRGDQVTRLDREGFDEWQKTSEPPTLYEPFLLVMISEMIESEDLVDAKVCHILMTFRHTQIAGKASRFQFARKSQLATLNDADLRVSVAVIGPDLTDFAKLRAKTATLDTKNYRLLSLDSNTTIDFSERN